MPVPLIAGVPAGYFALVGASVGTSLVASQGPIVYRKLHSKHYNWKYYWKRIPATQKELCISIIGWLFKQQKQVKGNTVIHTYRDDKFTYAFNLPQFNKNHKFKTKYGDIYIRIMSGDNINIAGIELAVLKRSWRSCWFIQKRKMNILNYMLKCFNEQIGIKSAGDIGTSSEPQIINNNISLTGAFPKEYADYLKKEKNIDVNSYDTFTADHNYPKKRL